MWHRLLVLLRIRTKSDWAPAGLGPEVNHPYFQHEALSCCRHCGGGWRNPVHREPYDERRTLEVLRIEVAKLEARPPILSAYLENISGLGS